MGWCIVYLVVIVGYGVDLRPWQTSLQQVGHIGILCVKMSTASIEIMHEQSAMNLVFYKRENTYLLEERRLSVQTMTPCKPHEMLATRLPIGRAKDCQHGINVMFLDNAIEKLITPQKHGGKILGQGILKSHHIGQ